MSVLVILLSCEAKTLLGAKNVYMQEKPCTWE